ncbi:hypothetical protein [Clostridium thermarum]|uniref:hypothetical protein n=1 Tax=Clostridium thermarum TaxID=1716543 RepID=UPI0013D3D470|nr:hypothetical protein [Clostridium thermarum]
MAEINEKKLQEALIKKTDEAVKLKEMVWSNIEKKLNSEEVKTVTTKRKKKGILKYAGIAAAFAAIVLAANPQYVDAAVDKIKELFVPQKTIEQSLEGDTEETKVDLEVSPQKYIIYIDKERYELKNIDGKDIIKPINMPESYPEVSMTIEQVTDKAPGEVLADIEAELKSKYSDVRQAEEVTEPVKGLNIRALGGNQWDSPVVNYYLVDNTNGGSFIIKEQYFLEASEGHGARFYHMLKEFKIVNE